jgi:anti-sigma regulatory factor (Ser/Thr protein kinase)
VIARGELCVIRDALPASATIVRHALRAFLRALDIDEEAQIDIVTAVGEALANTVEHAYDAPHEGELELRARCEAPGKLRVEVSDRGNFVDRVRPIDRGFGLKIMRAAAASLSVTKEGGTTIGMTFEIGR